MTFTNQTFIIRTLRDIYELPTVDMMVRCMQELTSLMQIQRSTVELLGEVADTQAAREGKPPVSDTVKWKFADEISWTDDNGGESKLQFRMGGKELLTVRVTHKERRNKRKPPGKEL